MLHLRKWATWWQPRLQIERNGKFYKTDYRMWKCVDFENRITLTPWIWEAEGNKMYTKSRAGNEFGPTSVPMNWAPWVDRSSPRSPYDFPYAFDDHFLILPVFKSAARADWYYTDRLRENDSDKYRRAVKKSGLLVSTPTVEQCRIFVEEYFGGSVDFYAYVLSCNHSTGYPIGVIGVVEK